MGIWFDLLLLLGGLIVLIVGGELLVRGAVKVAYYFQISSMVVGLTVVAFGTSSPELFVSIQAAFDNAPELSMGNVVGSNICNLTLVMGLTAIFYPIVVHNSSIKVDWFVTMGASVLLYFFVSRDLAVNRFEGVIFIIMIITYVYFQIEMSRKQTKDRLAKERAEGGVGEVPKVDAKGLVTAIGLFLVGSVGLYFGSDWFVGGAKNIALGLGVDKTVVGLTVIAIGTSLPELVTSSIAAYHKDTDIALGNLLGSNIFNILSILGITAAIKDIPVDNTFMEQHLLWMMGITMGILPMMITRRRIGRVEGTILLLVYGLYLWTLAHQVVH